MKRAASYIIVFLLCLPFVGNSQTEIALDPEYCGRLSLGVDKKLTRGMHLSLEEELRLDNNFSSLDRLQTTIGLSYKITKKLKVGIGYMMMNSFSPDSIKNTRHRLFLDASYSLHCGNWQLTLKERFQVTHRTGHINVYQNSRNLMGLKSRLTLKYKGLEHITPYGYIELRNTLNAPVVNATYNESTDTWGYYSGNIFVAKGEPGWFLNGYKGNYVNRFRTSLGLDWELNKKNRLDFYILIDYINEKKVDANAEGTRLKQYIKKRGFSGCFGAKYEFRF